VTLPPRFYDHRSSSELLSRLTFDVAQVADAATRTLTVFVRDTLAVIGLVASSTTSPVEWVTATPANVTPIGFAEYARTRQDILRDDVPLTVANHAWGVTGSYVLTGEPTSDRGVRPRAPFDPAAGSWGALQVAARYAELTLDPDIIATGGAAVGSSQKARQFSIGTNWFLNNFVRVYATYERHTFTGTRADENVIIFRSQLAF